MKKEALWYYEFNRSEDWMPWRDKEFTWKEWRIMTKKEFDQYCERMVTKHKMEIWGVKRRKASRAEIMLRETKEYFRQYGEN